MSRNKAFNYFDEYKKQADYAREMALNLKSALEGGEIGARPLVEALHTIENDADHVNHCIQAHLESDFVVPLERTGMCALAHSMDDVNDALEDIAIRAYMYDCRVIAPQGPKMVTLIAAACEHLSCAVDKLRDFHANSSLIKEQLLAIQNLESDCDKLYIESVHELYVKKDLDAEGRRIQDTMLDTIEEAMDAMEAVAERIEGVMTESM